VNSNEKVNGISFHTLDFKNPKINQTYLKSLLKNSISVQTKVSKNLNITDSNMSLVEIKLNIQNILDLADLASLEIAITDEENEFTWIGNRRNTFSDRDCVIYNLNSRKRLKQCFLL
jgi:hypothetical protein